MENIGRLESEFLDRHEESIEKNLCAQCEIKRECYRKEMALCAYFSRPWEMAGLEYREFLEQRKPHNAAGPR